MSPQPGRGVAPTVAERRVCRLAAALVLAGWVGVAAAAWAVRPDPAGLGTHQQFGLPPCTHRLTLGIDRCPSCGLTTAFSLLFRGRPAEAWRANPAVAYWGGLYLAGGFFGLWLWRRPEPKWLVAGVWGLTVAVVVYGVWWGIELGRVLARAP